MRFSIASGESAGAEIEAEATQEDQQPLEMPVAPQTTQEYLQPLDRWPDRGRALSALPTQDDLQPLDRGAVQKELDDTVSARKAMEAQMENLRVELELCQERRDSFLDKELELKRKLHPPMPSLSDFFAGNVRPDGPIRFQLEAQDDSPRPDAEVNFAFSDGGDDDASTRRDSYEDSWEHGLDSIGIAKCRLCGLKVPVDMEAIEKHSKECSQSEHERGELLGKCHACGELLPLNTEDIERHLNVCVMKKAPPPPQVPVPHGSSSQSAPQVPVPRGSVSQSAQRSSKRASGLWTFFRRDEVEAAADTIPSVASWTQRC